MPRDPSEVKEDLDLIHHPDKWSNWPFLPLKRTVANPAEPRIGLLAQGLGPTVIFGNIFMPVKAETPRKTYPSFQAILDDGWEVD